MVKTAITAWVNRTDTQLLHLMPLYCCRIDIANTFLPRSLNFMHTKYVVISEKLAKKGITELLMSLVRYREIRKTAHVVIVKGSAEDFLKENKPTIGTTLSKTMELLMEGTYNTGYFPNTTLHDFHNSVHSTYEQAIAIKGAVNDFKNIKENGNPIIKDIKQARVYRRRNTKKRRQ